MGQPSCCCSTPRQWWIEGASLPWPPACKAGALLTELSTHMRTVRCAATGQAASNPLLQGHGAASAFPLPTVPRAILASVASACTRHSRSPADAPVGRARQGSNLQPSPVGAALPVELLADIAVRSRPGTVRFCLGSSPTIAASPSLLAGTLPPLRRLCPAGERAGVPQVVFPCGSLPAPLRNRSMLSTPTGLVESAGSAPAASALPAPRSPQ